MFKRVIIGGTKKTDFTSATKRAALLIIAIAYLMRLNKHKNITAQRPAKAKTAYEIYLRYFPSFWVEESPAAAP